MVSATKCMPADFERQSAILLGANELFPHHPQVLTDLAKVLIERIPLIAVINGETQRRDLLAALCDWGLPAHRLRCVFSPAIGLWVRDYGPTFVRSEDRVQILDAEYYYPGRSTDDHFPSDFADLLGVEARDVPLYVEGGNILSNGKGMGLCSTALLARNAARYGPKDALSMLAGNYGFKTVFGLKPLIKGKTAHVDMFATFTSADTLVVGRYDPADDAENARLLDETEKVLKGSDTGVGPLKIERIPMPPHGDGVWRTYTNVIFANDAVVVPTYAGVDPGLERDALDTYRRLLPGREILPVEATSLAKTGGVLRCVSLNVPDLGYPVSFNGDGAEARRAVAPSAVG